MTAQVYQRVKTEEMLMERVGRIGSSRKKVS